MQATLSLQTGGTLPTHLPVASHLSTVVQALASLQTAPLAATWLQPSLTSQASVVQTLPSSQLVLFGPAQTPPPQMSPVVQALPSSQAAVLLVWTQPLTASQESLVQGLPSSQFGGNEPTHLPDASQTSAVVQALLSLQVTVGAGRLQTKHG